MKQFKHTIQTQLVKVVFVLWCLLPLTVTGQTDKRISQIKNKLEVLSVSQVGLTEQAKIDINVSNITLPNFILGISNAHNININVSSNLNNKTISNNNFSNVKVLDLLVFLCKEYSLTIDFTGDILSIKQYSPPAKAPEIRTVAVNYDPSTEAISIDAQNDKLYDVFKRITNESAKNLVFAPGLENKKLTAYVKDMPFENAMETLAISNGLYVEKTTEGFFLFEDDTSAKSNTKNKTRRRKNNETYAILDLDTYLLRVNFNKTPIARIVQDIATDLNLNIFTATPLDKAGSVTFKAKSITFDNLLVKIFESQTQTTTSRDTNSQNNTNRFNQNQSENRNTSITATPAANFTFKKEGDIYYFGTEDQLSVRKIEIIQLMHRSVELLSGPEGGGSRNRTVGGGLRNNLGNGFNTTFNTTGNLNQNTLNSNSGFNNRSNLNRQQNRSSNNSFNTSNGNSGGNSETIDAIIPAELSQDLNIVVDNELNSLYVTGVSAKIDRLKDFIKSIDKTVPVVLIEVMFVEVNKNNAVDTGITWGLGEETVETGGQIFPLTDLTLGASTINRVINGFDGFDQLNLGKVVPNFSATIRAMETNGNLKVRSTPRLSTLNGHRATFSNGETSYYTVTQRNIFGTDNPQSSEITNFEPIDAELGLTIKPLVSGDGQVTLDIFVIQSSFGDRIDENAPPDISSREFSSIIRVQDQDIVVLGGLEEQRRSNTGTGIPLLSRIPVLKWLFSSRRREASKAKLTVFIKPTIIY